MEITAAEQMIASGNTLEAIEFLTECNRAKASARVESQLLRLRNQALSEVGYLASPRKWPTAAPDIFRIDDIPEIGPESLNTATLRAGILNQGAIIVRGLLSLSKAERVLTWIHKAFAARDAWLNGAPVRETRPWFAPFSCPGHKPVTPGNFVVKAGGLWTADSPRVAFKLIELYREIGLKDLVADYLGERAALSVQKWTLRRVPVTTGSNWHQDGAFLGRDIRTVNFWLTLSDCGVDAPGLDIIPRRLQSIVETGTEGASFDWSVGDGVVDRLMEGKPVKRLVFEPGDAIFFDQLNLHRTGVSPGMSKDRYAIETWFFTASQYPASYAALAF